MSGGDISSKSSNRSAGQSTAQAPVITDGAESAASVRP